MDRKNQGTGRKMGGLSINTGELIHVCYPAILYIAGNTGNSVRLTYVNTGNTGSPFGAGNRMVRYSFAFLKVTRDELSVPLR